MYKVKLIHASDGHKMEHYSTMKVTSLDGASDELYFIDIKKRLMKFANLVESPTIFLITE